MNRYLITALLAGGLLLQVSCSHHINSGGENGGRVSVSSSGGTEHPFRFVVPETDSNAPQLSAESARALFKLVRLDPLSTRDLGTLRKVMKLPDRMFEQYGGYVAVSLYFDGLRDPLTGVAAGGNLAFSAAGAARIALGNRPAADLAKARIRIDLVYDLEPCEAGTRMIPGIEGLATISGKTQALLPPDQYLSDNPDVADYILRLEKQAGLPEGTWKNNRMMLAKYRSVAVVQIAAGQEPVFLQRSNVMIAEPDAEEAWQSGRRGIEWLCSAQKPDGSFRYTYYPRSDRYEEEKYNIVRHAGAAFALFGYARLARSRNSAVNSVNLPAFKAGEAALSYLKGVAGTDRRYGFVYIADGRKVKLGAAALALAAFCERERAGGDSSHRGFMRNLAEFILNQQTPQGEFLSNYDPQKGRPEGGFISLYYPGEAMLALVRLYRLGGMKDSKILEACHRGAAYLIEFQQKRALANIHKGVKAGEIYLPDAWFLQVLEELINIDDRPEYRRHLFEIADCLCDGQLTPSPEGKSLQGQSTRFPDLVGAMDESDPPSVCATGARAEGLVAALRVARKAGDNTRAARYTRALSMAGRFVGQNQFHRYNAYLLPDPGRALGGFRATPLDCSIRIDYVQHCSSFMLEWAELQKR